MQKLTISEETLETLGSHSLQGIAFNAGMTTGPLTLVFKTSGPRYRIEHNGPKIIVMPDFVPFCLVESILAMQRQGWVITIRTG